MQIRKRIRTTIIITSVASLLIGGGLGFALVRSIGSIQGQIAEAQRAVNDQLAIQGYIRREASRIDGTLVRLRALTTAAVKEGGELELITSLETIARQSNVEQTINLNTAGQQEISSWEKKIPIHLQLSGLYGNFMTYLHRLERMPYLITITDLNLVRDGDASLTPGRAGLMRADINAEIYWIGDGRPEFLLDQIIVEEADHASQP
jgi:hypothetical protein